MSASKISPIPFCPSFEPCAKLTPPQVASSTPRIQIGGLSPSAGGAIELGVRQQTLHHQQQHGGGDESDQAAR